MKTTWIWYNLAIKNRQKVKIYDLYLYAFIAGFVILSLEILAFRMLAPYFGSSVFVSGSVITVILVFLSLGYFIN